LGEEHDLLGNGFELLLHGGLLLGHLHVLLFTGSSEKSVLSNRANQGFALARENIGTSEEERIRILLVVVVILAFLVLLVHF